MVAAGSVATSLRRLLRGRALVLGWVAACALVACDSDRDTAPAAARSETMKALALSKTGAPLEEQLAHLDQALRHSPDSAEILAHRASLLFALDRVPEARAGFDRAVTLADRPYLRFERADVLCALGEIDAALADLDSAIAGQPANDQFYPRRALARLAAGRIADARADVEHALAAGGSPGPRSYALAAVLLMESRPREAFAAVDPIREHADETDAARVRVLRLLALTALGEPERAAAEFDASRLASAAHWPRRGPRWWFTSRGCDNAFVPIRAGALVARAEALLPAAEGAGGRSIEVAAVPARASPTAAVPARASPMAAAPAPVRFPRQPFLVVRSTDRSAFVDLDRLGQRAVAAAPTRLQLLDEHGVRIGRRVAVRRTCASTCGEAADEQCHVVGEYRFRGAPIARFAVALDRWASVDPRPIDRSPVPRPAQLATLERLFAKPLPAPVEAEVVFSWAPVPGSDDWTEQSTRRIDRGPLVARPTGARFAACSLATYAELTEFFCPDRRSIYLVRRHLGGSDGPSLGSLLRFAADIDGTAAYFVVVSWNSVEHLRIVFWRPDGWHEDFVRDDRTVC